MPTKKDLYRLPVQLSIFSEALGLTLQNKVNKKELLHKLNNASYVCAPCGSAFSNPLSCTGALFATFHIGHCDICNHDTSVTSIRDFNYLLEGRTALEDLIRKEKDSNKSKSKSSIEGFLNLCDKKGV